MAVPRTPDAQVPATLAVRSRTCWKVLGEVHKEQIKPIVDEARGSVWVAPEMDLT